MSLLAPHVGIMAPATPSGKTPVDDLYAKWMVAAIVFFVTLKIIILMLAGRPSSDKPWFDGMNYVIGRDFLNTWMGGRSMFGHGPAA